MQSKQPTPQHDFYAGIRYALQGFKEMFRPGVKRYVYLPSFISVLVFGSIFYFGVQYILHKFDFQFLHSLPKWLAWLSWLISFIKSFLIGVTISLLLAVCAILSTVFANLFGAPFNGLLSEAYSTSLGKTLPSRSLVRTIGVTLLREGQKYLYIIPRAIGVGIFAAILFFIPILNLILPLLFY